MVQCWPRAHRYTFTGKLAGLNMSGSLFFNRVQHHRTISALFVQCWLGSSFRACGTTANRGRHWLEHHNNVEAKNKDGQKNKRQDSPIKKNKGSRKRKCSSPFDKSVSDNQQDSSSEDSDINNGSSSEPSKEKCRRMSIPHQGSLPSLQQKRINVNLAYNGKSGQRQIFEAHFWPANNREYIRE